MKIEVKDFCPALVEKPKGPRIEFDPAVQSSDSETCWWGSNMPMVIILGDRMVRKIGDVEVSCEGCHLLKGGFKKIVKRKIA